MKKFSITKLFLSSILCLASNLIAHAQAGEWTWMSGSNTINGTVALGTQGVPSVNNNPSGLYEACEWTDTSGMFWLYGGDSNSGGTMANLWKYNPATNEWTWVNGPGNFGTVPVYGTQGVADPSNTPGSRGLGTTSFTGKDGNLWLFGGYGSFGANNDLWKYDISINEWTWMNGPSVANDPGSYGTQGVPSATNVPRSRSECAMSWTDSTGNLWLFGGWFTGTSGNDLWRYDPTTNEWTWMKGSSSSGATGVYGTMGVPDPANTPGARNSYTKWNDGHNNLYLFAGDAFALGELYNDVWKYSIATNEWVWISGTNQGNNGGSASSQCSPNTDDYPSGRREGRACWVDPCKKFWYFGGSSQGSFYGSQNDLWMFNPVTLEWTWVNGSLSIYQNGSFGTQGVSSPTNQPPSRSGSNTFVDHDGNLWLFGGTDMNWPSAWNDMWRFVPDSLCTGSCNINQQQINFSASNTQLCEKYCTNYTDVSTNNPASWQWLFPGGNPSSSTLQNPTNICYNLPGTYDVTLITTNANGSDTLTLNNYITVYPTPPFPTITQVGYTLTSSSATSYQWQFNSYDIPGATNQSYTVTQSGYYTVIVGDTNDCVNSFTVYVLISGVEDAMSDASVSIYPNPSAGNFIVEWSNGLMVGDVSIDVLNTLGQKVFSSSENISSLHFKKEIDLGEVAHGVYFIEIKTESEFLRKKILIAE